MIDSDAVSRYNLEKLVSLSSTLYRPSFIGGLIGVSSVIKLVWHCWHIDLIYRGAKHRVRARRVPSKAVRFRPAL